MLNMLDNGSLYIHIYTWPDTFKRQPCIIWGYRWLLSLCVCVCVCRCVCMCVSMCVIFSIKENMSLSVVSLE